ncbi:type II secretion system minor pseudopilin GspJ [Thalassotalea aquiviva]|uniref:type II secretion system minor pseudopilin GspJ n=1 Tax=Thalassotalea aquiviva TaxID=3242415 RepID=UPI00352A8A41
MRNKGFTLLEVLIAVALFAIISLASTAMLTNIIESSDANKIKTSQINQLQRAFLVMERDFLQMTRRTIRLEGEAPLKNFIYSSETSFASVEQGIGFVRTGWRNPALLLPRSDVQALGYQLEEQTLNRIHYVFADPVVGEEPKVRPLLNGVKSLAFEYYYANKWQENLPTSDLPEAIAVEIELEEYGLIRRQFLLPSTMSSTENND